EKYTFLYSSWLFQMVRAMEGQGTLKANAPDIFLPLNSISFPASSINTGCTPGRGKVANVGLGLEIPAIVEIIMAPVSVCHQVSTIGQLPLPMCLSYQCQASSLIGSPTLPKTFKELKS